MEEDIIILETAIKYSKKQFEEIGEYDYLDKDKMQAIENLIKRNEELEEKVIENVCKGVEELVLEEYRNKIKELEEENKEKTKMIIDQDRNLQISYYSLQELFELRKYKNNSIPKSKIKEKIEELNKKEKQELKGIKGNDRYFIKQMYQTKIQVLEELLGG